AIRGERLLELADLVSLGQVGIEVALPRPHAAWVHRAVEGERRREGEPDGLRVHGGQGARQPQAHGADVRVRRLAERHPVTAKELPLGPELHVDLHADDDVPGHVVPPVGRTPGRSSRPASMLPSPDASRAASSTAPAATRAGSPHHGARIWPPTGSPPERPTGTERPGMPARLAVTV